MGTNYYRKPILTKEHKKKLHELIDMEKFHSTWEEGDDPKSSVTNMIAWLTEGVHICKMSVGWYTCFDHNLGKYYQPNRKSLEEFLSEPGYEIVDEYGEKYTPEEFWNEVDERDARPNLWDSEGYAKWEKENNGRYYDHRCTDDIAKCEQMFNVHPTHNDFTVDNLRFAVFTDFS